jgi:selenocysteine-specific elongation factor
MPLIPEQINITLGTAGHIDHGKTALIKCITGCDTDRLKEEKERGMSIELGFAPCTLSDIQVGIVDVPGHENFIRTMVAGATGIDAVILVVAADDGVMPQTREHMDILTLLGVRHGVIALTKIDRVSAEQRETVRNELRAFLNGTFLAEAPILPVSNVTGEGLGELTGALGAMVRSIRPKPTDGVFRLPVERTFSAKGYGTVVCGIPVSGSARVGDELVLLPQDVRGRIKSIQVYKRPSQAVKAGQCTAINIPHWDHDLIERGHTVTVPGFFAPYEWCVCKLRLLAHETALLKSGTRIKFHTGTSEVLATVYLLQGNRIQAGEESLVQLRLDTPLVAGPADRFILRTPSPAQTIGGGQIIEMGTRRLKRNRPEVYQGVQELADAIREPGRFLEYCLRRSESPAATEADLSVRTKLPTAQVREILNDMVRRGDAVPLDTGLYAHREAVAEAGRRLVNTVDDYHRASPESPGITTEQLRQSCELPKPLFEVTVGLLVKEGRLAERGQRLALAEHRQTIAEQDRQLIDAVESLFREGRFAPPSVDEAVERTRVPRDQVDRAIKALIETDRLVRVPEGLLFHCEAVEKARELLVAFIQKEGRLESVKFKYLLGTTRKFAIPLLDHFDRIGLTVRRNNTRYLKR